MDLFFEAVEYLQENNVPVLESDEDEEENDEAVFCRQRMVSFTFAECPLGLPRGSDDSLPASPDTKPDAEASLKKRTSALQKMSECERQYVSELEALVLLKKALKMTANTSQPVLTAQQIQAIFFHVPELLQLHQGFYQRLKQRLDQEDSDQMAVGDLFQYLVTQLGVYRSYISNHELALQTVKKCAGSDERFRKVAEAIKLPAAAKDVKSVYTLEDLLLAPIDRVTRNTLALHDLLRYTPEDHPDHLLLQDALCTSNHFLSVVNKEIFPRKGSENFVSSKRCLVKDGFITDVSDGTRRLRHLFLFSDLLLCAKLKSGKQEFYKLEWFVPLTDVTLQSSTESEVLLSDLIEPPELLQDVRLRIYQAKLEHQEEKRLSRGTITRAIEKARKKLMDTELWLLKNAPSVPLNIHSKKGKVYDMFLEFCFTKLTIREFHSTSVLRLRALGLDRADRADPEPDPFLKTTTKVVPLVHSEKGTVLLLHNLELDLDSAPLMFSSITKLTSMLVDLRRTEKLPLQSETGSSFSCSLLCGTLTVALHSIRNLPTTLAHYVTMEADSYGYFEKKSESSDISTATAAEWEEEKALELDGARALRLLCYERAAEKTSGRGRLLGRTQLQLDSLALQPQEWTEICLDLNGMQMLLSLQFIAHDLQPPSATSGMHAVFGVPIASTSRRDGSLIPHIVLRCVEQVDRRGLEELGIYRISGLATDVQVLRAAFNTDPRVAAVRVSSMDVNAVAGILKLYLRELPEPLLCTELFAKFTQGLDICDPVEKDAYMRVLLESLPEDNMHTFLFLLEHLKRVAAREPVNKMSLYNLATVFGPTLLRPPEREPSEGGFPSHISQEVVVQVQVLLHYLQCETITVPQERRRTRLFSVQKVTSEEHPAVRSPASPLPPRR